MPDDPLSNILRSKRETTRFQVLVEVAEHQPSIRQQEIAEKLGVTPQAISEYVRDQTASLVRRDAVVTTSHTKALSGS